MWSTLFPFGIPPFFYLSSNMSVVKIYQYHECIVLSISSLDMFWSALGSSIVILIICMSFRSGMSFLLSCSFSGPKSVTIGNDPAVTAIYVSCFPWSSYDHQSLFVAPFLGYYSALLSLQIGRLCLSI
jgi:hypothetical protein